MADIIVNAQRREGKGKGPARRLRQQGLIPAVVYGRKQEPTHLSVDPAGLLKAIETPQVQHPPHPEARRRREARPLQGLGGRSRLAEARARGLPRGEPRGAREGRRPGRHDGSLPGQAEGGILSLATHEIVFEALPAKIPVRIEVDITNLKIGQSIHVSQLTPPEGCKFKFSTDYVVAFLAVPEKEEVAAPVAAVVAGATPAEGAAAAGAPAAAGAAAAGGEAAKKAPRRRAQKK